MWRDAQLASRFASRARPGARWKTSQDWASPGVEEGLVKAALDRRFCATLRPLALGVAILYAVLGVRHIVSHGGWTSPLAVFDYGIALALLVLFLVLGRHEVPPRFAHPVAAAIAGGVLVGEVLHARFLGFDEAAPEFALVALAAGILFMSWPWFLAVVAASAVGWGFAAFLSPGSVPIALLTLFVETAGIAFIVFFVSRRRAWQAETLTIMDARRREELERMARELGERNRELEAFSYSVSHDLRAPLRTVEEFSRFLVEDHSEQLDSEGRRLLDTMRGRAAEMRRLIDAMLQLSLVTRADVGRAKVPLGAVAREVMDELRTRSPKRAAEVDVDEEVVARGEPELLRILMENLLGNAWKYTARQPVARISFGVETGEGGERVYAVRDNGVGFPPERAGDLFRPFTRLHGEQFAGTGVGLATARRVVVRHGGRIWATSRPGEGAAFFFTLGEEDA